MSLKRVTSRYAKSLIELAQERKVLDAVEKDMKLFLTTCSANRDLRLALQNPILLHSKKSTILERIFGDKINELTLSFFKIITRKGRENILFEIAEEFELQALAKKGILKAKLTTATDLPQKQKDSIIQILSKSVGQKVQLEEKIDAELIGGFIIKIEDQQIDSSIKADLIRMKKKFNDSTYISKL